MVGTWCHSLDSSLRLMGLTRKSLAPALKASEITSSLDSEDITAAGHMSGQPCARGSTQPGDSQTCGTYDGHSMH